MTIKRICAFSKIQVNNYKILKYVRQFIIIIPIHKYDRQQLSYLLFLALLVSVSMTRLINYKRTDSTISATSLHFLIGVGKVLLQTK